MTSFAGYWTSSNNRQHSKVRILVTESLTLYVDTNFFIHCKGMDAIEWGIWTQHKTIHLLVCETVVREIDALKKDPINRVRKKAARTSALFRKILDDPNERFTIHDMSPTVFVEFDKTLKPSEQNADSLDYSINDHRIIGFIVQFKGNNPNEDVRFMSADTIARFIGQRLGVTYAEIPSQWRSPEPNDPLEIENQKLRNELTEIRDKEPIFDIKTLNQIDPETEILSISHPRYIPLTNNEIDHLVEVLKQRFPMQSFFDDEPPQRSRRTVLDQFVYAASNFVPPSDEQIDEYKNVIYPSWIMNCRKYFAELHNHLQSNLEWPHLAFDVSNDSNNTARNALVRVVVHGDILIRPPEYVPETANGETDPDAPSLPNPPIPPRGYFPAERTLSQMAQGVDTFLNTDLNALAARAHHAPVRELDQFYYKGDRSTEPVDIFELTCEQWRHRDEDEYFETQVCFDLAVSTHSGKIGLWIFAENLRQPVRKFVPIEITVEPHNVQDEAMRMIGELKRL